jgi:hypothetical protein
VQLPEDVALARQGIPAGVAFYVTVLCLGVLKTRHKWMGKRNTYGMPKTQPRTSATSGAATLSTIEWHMHCSSCQAAAPV